MIIRWEKKPVSINRIKYKKSHGVAKWKTVGEFKVPTYTIEYFAGQKIAQVFRVIEFFFNYYYF